MRRDLQTFAEAEARVKISHFTQQGFDLAGIVHGGANDGEEVYYYERMGLTPIFAFEPLMSALEILVKNYPNAHAVPLALGNHNGEVTLHVTYGDGKGSSILEPDMNHPEVKANWTQGQAIVVDEVQVRIRRFRNWADNNKTLKNDIAACDTLVLDTQGNELDVLRGMGKYLKQFKFLSIELSDAPIYEGEAAAQTVVDYLINKGYTLDSPIYSHNDVFFVRSDIKPVSDGAYHGLC